MKICKKNTKSTILDTYKTYQFYMRAVAYNYFDESLFSFDKWKARLL